MPYVHGPARLALAHHNAPAWPTDLLTFDEADRHLSRLTRIAGCGCMRYLDFTSRPHTRVQLPGGVTKDIAVARLMCTLSADRPLGPTDFACHACNNEECCHPDHLYAGTACTNMQDRFRRRRIRERRAARFYDEALLRIAEQPAHPWPLTPTKPKLPHAAERLRLVLDVPRDRQALNLSVMVGPTRKPFRALSAS